MTSDKIWTCNYYFFYLWQFMILLNHLFYYIKCFHNSINFVRYYKLVVTHTVFYTLCFKFLNTMANKFTSIANIQTGFHATNLKIKVRVIRLWRGTTKKGEEFTSFNILLLDCKVTFVMFSSTIISAIEQLTYTLWSAE